MKNLLQKFTIIALIVCFTSCKKELLTTSNQILVNKSQSKDGIPCFPFSWETADYMPTPPGSPSILVPWASGSNQNFDPDIAFDFKSQDGWFLVYNTFNTTSLTSPNFFALYNKFRGLLRFYAYLPPNTPVPSTYLNHGLNLSGSGATNSPMLNYIGTDVTNSLNSTANTQIENYQLQSTGGWYVSQYEIAYDSNIANTSQSNLNMVWYAQSINITQLKIDGTSSGTVKTAVAQPNNSSGINYSGVETQAGKGALAILGLTAFKQPITTAQSSKGLSSAIFKAIGNGLSGSLTGAVSGILNAILGGSSSNSQSVNLTLNETLALTGTASNNTSLWNITLAIPGSSNSQNAVGYIPNYNSPMGVFNVSTQPIVNIIATNNTDPSSPGGAGSVDNSSTTYSFSIDNNSFASLINPVVLNSATVSIVPQVVLMNPPANIHSYQGSLEDVGGKTVYGNLNYIVTDYDQGTYPFPGLGVRFVITITPNNGAPVSKIVKTFSATPNVTIVN